MHPEHDLARELWATERCRAAGVPAPRLLAADLAPGSGGAPFAVHERLPGRPGARVALSPTQRRSVLEELGRLAARIHSVRVPGVGDLAPLDARGGQVPDGEPAPYGYGGTSVSWWGYASGALEGHLRNLPPGALPSELSGAVRRRFEEGRPVLEAAVPPGSPDSALVHADFRLENTLLVRDPSGGVRVSAVLDFEMALAGDGAFDIAYLASQDARDEDDLVAILRGYGTPSGPAPEQPPKQPFEQPPGQAETQRAGPSPGGPAGIPAAGASLRRRLLLYQLPQALEHLWWAVNFRDEAATARVLARLRTLVDALEPHPTSA
jgi:hypothetical protein